MSAADQIGFALTGPVPDVAEPIRGFRRWEWDLYGLTSFGDVRWSPDEPLQATCRASVLPARWAQASIIYGAPSPVIGGPLPSVDHACPWDPHREPHAHDTHGCGIYAYSTIEGAWANLSGSNPEKTVLGEVELWGKVWPHEYGYRGEFARPVVLYRPRVSRPTIWGDPIEGLARMYGCEVRDLPLDADARAAIEEESRKKELEWSLRLSSSLSSAQLRASFGYPSTTRTAPTGWFVGESIPDPEPPRHRKLRWLRSLCLGVVGAATGWSTGWAGIYAHNGNAGWAAFHGACAAVDWFFLSRMWRRG